MEGYKKPKITLSMLKGKPINSSVPSFRFNATAEEIEELYATDEDHDELSIDTPAKAASDVESSPYKSNKLGKRSTSVDVSTVDLSPPSDPWRFFSDIKGKITKSVEGKITEYKTRSSEGEGASPKRSSKTIKEGKECKELGSKDTKETVARDSKEGSKEKDCSSLSDSEELSESSISRTCGIVSTTEGVEMSSDDEGTTSLSDKKDDKDNNAGGSKSNSKHGSKQKRNITVVNKDGKKETKTTTVGFLDDLQKINMGIEIDQSDVESGVDVLAQIDNIDVDIDQINITQISGEDIRKGYFDKDATQETTVFSPMGFVDLRPPPEPDTNWQYFYRNRIGCYVTIVLIAYLILPLSTYMSGFITGSILMYTAAYIYTKLVELGTPYQNEVNNNHSDGQQRRSVDVKQEEFVEIQPVKEERPTLKYQGWVNEYPEVYDPYTYHISQTQSVYLRLQGNLLKISNARGKIPKRASYNEAEHKMSFSRHRIYNLLAAEIVLLPLGLTKIRHWSKKYPICIILNKDQLCYDHPDKDKKASPETDLAKEVASSKGSSTITSESSGTQIFSKLIEESAVDNEDNSYFELAKEEDEVHAVTTTSADEISMQNDDELLEDEVSFFDTQETVDPQMDLAFLHDPVDQTCIYIFARTDREKEHWYRRFKRATHRLGHSDGTASQDSASDIVKDDTHYYSKYLKIMSPILNPIESGGTYSMFMAYYSSASSLRTSETSLRGRRSRQSMEIEDCTTLSPNLDLQWLNTMIYRMVFDFHQSDQVIKMIQDRIARKLAAIKLPIFIESLRMTELTFGNFAPKVCKIGKPYLDDWGLWIDFDLSYEGSVIIMVLTKLNLLKLKQQGESHRNGMESPTATGSNTKSAIYHSDVEDTAESSSDDERVKSAAHTPLDESGYPVPGLGGASKQNKKFMTMVDRFAESKFFQRATENKYIKKAIEGVSNTDVGLKLELKALKGCLVVNVPPPPSDRIWFGFRSAPMPKLQLTAHPVVGEKNWNFNKVSTWIEKRVYKEFLKVLLLPNMEDILVPGMDPRLPE
ncbi:testis-expressed protein 2 isoform X1 [Atheta coriaria]|uniref:testis-expressed protein 2 isoform X1 n=1 Tax=Dalotia coriaria TaxID=877792 RepID=UPI0031F3D885